METLSVGMYVKFKTLSNQVKVGQIQLIDNSIYELDNNEVTADKYIVKASYNIIDILEKGDYVNEYEVTSKDQFLGFGNHDWYMTNDEIKSIVTKEQFEAMEYKVGE